MAALFAVALALVGCGGRTIVAPDELIAYTYHNDDGDEYYTVSQRAKNIGGELVIPSTFKDLPVRGIDEGGFQDCVYLTSVVISDGITDIGRNAFYNCSGLMRVTFGKDVSKIGGEAFRFCRKIIEIYDYSSLNIAVGESLNGFVAYYASHVYNDAAPSAITKDGEFSYYSDGESNYLVTYEGESEEVVLPELYNGQSYELYPYAFVGSYVKKITLPSTLEAIGEYAFSRSNITEITIPGSVERVGNNAFYDCDELVKVKLESGVKEIGESAFHTCSKLAEIEYTTLEEIGESAFYGCRELKVIEIGNSVRKIGARAFYDCTELKTLEVEGSTAINEYAFYGCTSLISVNAPNALVGNYAFASCSRLESVTVAGDIAMGAFRDCTRLSSFEVKGDVGASAFQGCTALASVTFSSATTAIGSTAFRNCERLTALSFPTSLKSIAIYAFSGCTALKSATFADASNWFFTTDNAAFEARTGGTASDLSSVTVNAERLKAISPYENGYWYRGE